MAAKTFSNWGNMTRRAYPFIGSGLIIAGLGCYLGGFPNVYSTSKLVIFDLNGTVPAGYLVYLGFYALLVVLARANQQKAIETAEQRALGVPAGMKRMLI